MELLDTTYSPLARSGILWERGHWSSQTLLILRQHDQVYCEREDIGAPRHFIFSLSIIRYIVRENTLELLDTSHSPLALSGKLRKRTHWSYQTLHICPQHYQVYCKRKDIGVSRHSIFSISMIRYIVKENILQVPNNPYLPFS